MNKRIPKLSKLKPLGKKGAVHRFLHVEVSPAVADAWRKFRDKMKVKRGPLEEQALVEFMEHHDPKKATRRPEVSE